ncbi:hypothetical protein GCM10007877_29690 [Marinibactrum halimedae]|uniref:Uncharacterized protein n=1 Tax=Marinibactrum halimedae TaxID=1444977 RepID=A0AA37TC21_9GAMM|nr:hypothetical protein GCM10007877_29690 [Marinibactrum halimedae]
MPSKHSISLELNSQNYSDAMPIHQLVNNLEGPPPDEGDFAFSHSRMEMTYATPSFRLHAFERLDYFVEYTPNTIDFIHRDQNDTPLENNTVYNIDLSVSHLRASGIGVSFPLLEKDNYSFSLRTNYWYGKDIIDGRIHGSIAGDNSDITNYNGDLTLNYTYTEDHLLDRAREEFNGHGFGIDIMASGKLFQSTYWQLNIEDFLTRTLWSQATYTRANANTNSIRFDEDGRLSSVAVVSGFEGNKRHTQRLPIRTQGSITHAIQSQWNAAFGFNSIGFNTKSQHVIANVGLQYQREAFSLGGFYEPDTDSLRLSLNSRFLGIDINMDSLDEKEARRLGVNLRMTF